MAVLNGIEDVGIQDTVLACDNMAYYQSVGAYLRGARKPHYPVPAIRYGTLLLNWKGSYRFCVVFANQWGGYATLITNVYVEDV